MEAIALDQAERIRQAVEKSFSARDLYVEKQAASMVASLREAEKRVKADLFRYADLGALTSGQKINQVRLTALHERIDDSIKALKSEHSTLLKQAARETHLDGMTEGALELKVQGLPATCPQCFATRGRRVARHSGEAGTGKAIASIAAPFWDCLVMDCNDRPPFHVMT